MAKKENLAEILRREIEEYEGKVESSEEGTVISVGDGIARVYGLSEARLGELILFSSGAEGLVMNLDEEELGIALLTEEDGVKEGDAARRTRRIIEVPVGDALLGRVVTPLGEPLDGGARIETGKTRPVERIAPGVMTRKSVDTPLHTGIKSIDSMIPIGRGQRELIIGDRQTGKTAIAIDAILSQKGQGVKCIYVAIGQKDSSVADLVDLLRKEGAMDYTLVVDAPASKSAPILYIAPFAGMAMAEEWLERGEDVLIVFDDLSKHAVSYRALSLLLRRAPGREAYPGDIFYLHSRLLERACRLDEAHGGGSITALPIVETQAGDISAYIPTNIISITDGQIFLDSSGFASGQRPAIDAGLSVSRVGSSAQHPAMKKVSRSLKMTIATYRENLSFAQFGSDLDETTKKILLHGDRAMEALRQVNGEPLSEPEEVLTLFALQEGHLDSLPRERVRSFLGEMLGEFRRKHAPLMEKLLKEGDYDKGMEEEMRKEILALLAREEDR